MQIFSQVHKKISRQLHLMGVDIQGKRTKVSLLQRSSLYHLLNTSSPSKFFLLILLFLCKLQHSLCLRFPVYNTHANSILTSMFLFHVMFTDSMHKTENSIALWLTSWSLTFLRIQTFITILCMYKVLRWLRFWLWYWLICLDFSLSQGSGCLKVLQSPQLKMCVGHSFQSITSTKFLFQES